VAHRKRTVSHASAHPTVFLGAVFIRGFSLSGQQTYALSSAPEEWRALPQWVPWIETRPRSGRVQRWRRAILAPHGGRTPNASSRYWQSFNAALTLAERLELGAAGGGVAFVFPPADGATLYSGVFFVLPPSGRSGRALAVFKEPGGAAS
jgi:hypothetical protein